MNVAVQLYEAAAEQQDPWAQNHLGFLYSQGKGVEQSDKLAMEWYKKAAVQGHSEARFNIGARYARGQGVEVDLVEAHYWISKAQLGASAVLLARSEKTLEQLMKNMTSQQIKESQKKFEDFIKRLQ